MTASSAKANSLSLIKIDDLSDLEIFDAFKAAEALEKSLWQAPVRAGISSELAQKVMIEAFFEPSTRTRLSFQMAAQRLGVNVVGCDFETSSSIVKGEAESDTLLNLSAMKPDMMIVRTKGGAEILAAMEHMQAPILNAGFGQIEHPTQALLDVYTLKRNFGRLEGIKLAIIGDVTHSRVAGSNIKIFKRLGAEVAVCAPQVPGSGGLASVKVFESIHDAAKWADVVMGLRVQVERFERQELTGFVGENKEKYIREYRLDANNLKNLGEKALIMHPGPFVPGVDFDPQLLSDPRCVIHQQVTNGVYVRGALILRSLGYLGSVL